jgi:carnosine N-methyltransferase
MIDDIEEGISRMHMSYPSLNASEQRQFAKVITTFKNYAQYSLLANNRRRKDIYTLPRADQELLNDLDYKQKLDDVDKAILLNAEFLAKIVEDTQIFDQPENRGEYQGSEDTHSHDHSGTSVFFWLGS